MPFYTLVHIFAKTNKTANQTTMQQVLPAEKSQIYTHTYNTNVHIYCSASVLKTSIIRFKRKKMLFLPLDTERQ